MLIEMESSIRYAGLAVSYDERDTGNADVVVCFPKLIVEVLSQSTAAYDLGRKKREYLRIPTLEEYAIVDSRKRWTQVFRSDKHWAAETFEPQGSDAFNLQLNSIGLTLDLKQLYSTIDL